MRYIDTYARNKRNPESGRLPRRTTAPDHGDDLLGDPLPGAVDADREVAGRLHRRPGRRPAQGDRQEEPRGDGALKDAFVEGARASGTGRPGDQRAVVDQRGCRRLLASTARHAACYALISYRTAWLKANYPAEYMAALISSVMSTKDKVPFFVSALRGDGHRGAAAGRERVGPRLRRHRRQHPLRPRRRQERGLRRRRCASSPRARKAGRSPRSGTSAAASTAAP